MSKFKVGDRVKICKPAKSRNWVAPMNEYVGTVMTICKTDDGNSWIREGYRMSEDGREWYWELDMISKLVSTDHHELHITSDGTTTNAVYKLNGKVEKQAKAVCCPSDTYNFNTGAELAINRVLYGTDYNPKDVALKPTQPIAPQEDKPKFVVGDKVQLIVGIEHCHWADEIYGKPLTIKHTFSDGKFQVFENIYTYEAKWLEPYAEPEQPKEPIVLYCIKDYVNYRGTKWLTKGETYQFKNGLIAFDGGYMAQFYSSYDRFCESNKGISDCLIKTEKRPAKVGEWVLITEGRTEGVIGIVESILHTGYPRVKHRDVWDGMFAAEDGTERTIFSHNQYLVLDNYQPEPEKEPEPVYLTGKVVCCDFGTASGSLTVGKVYSVKDGKFLDDLSRTIPGYELPFESIVDMNAKCAKHSNAKFIPYLGEA